MNSRRKRMTTNKKVQCKHCRDEMFCKLQEEGCDGYIEDCPDYET